MPQDLLIPFTNGIATIRSSGVVDIRLVDDANHHTLTGRMSVEEVTRIAEEVASRTPKEISITAGGDATDEP